MAASSAERRWSKEPRMATMPSVFPWLLRSESRSIVARRDSASIVRGSVPTAIAPPPGCQIKRGGGRGEISAREGECLGRAGRLGGRPQPFWKLLEERGARRLGDRRGGRKRSDSVAVPEAGGDAWCVAVEEGPGGELFERLRDSCARVDR
jgi:hypothetical protein